jgi:hypothetical protein
MGNRTKKPYPRHAFGDSFPLPGIITNIDRYSIYISYRGRAGSPGYPHACSGYGFLVQFCPSPSAVMGTVAALRPQRGGTPGPPRPLSPTKCATASAAVPTPPSSSAPSTSAPRPLSPRKRHGSAPAPPPRPHSMPGNARARQRRRHHATPPASYPRAPSIPAPAPPLPPRRPHGSAPAPRPDCPAPRPGSLPGNARVAARAARQETAWRSAGGTLALRSAGVGCVYTAPPLPPRIPRCWGANF